MLLKNKVALITGGAKGKVWGKQQVLNLPKKEQQW